MALRAFCGVRRPRPFAPPEETAGADTAEVSRSLELIPYKLPQLEDKGGYLKSLSISLLSLAFRGSGDISTDAKWWEQTLELATMGTSLVTSSGTSDLDEKASLRCRSHFQLAEVISPTLLKKFEESRAAWQHLKAIKGPLGIDSILKSSKDTSPGKASEDGDWFLHRFAAIFTLSEHLERLFDLNHEVDARAKHETFEDRLNEVFAEYTDDSTLDLGTVDLAVFQNQYFSAERLPRHQKKRLRPRRVRRYS